eukprot:COSAG06_NODE_33986_length_481_cov_1.078534_2_plen_84_part_01
MTGWSDINQQKLAERDERTSTTECTFHSMPFSTLQTQGASAVSGRWLSCALLLPAARLLAAVVAVAAVAAVAAAAAAMLAAAAA